MKEKQVGMRSQMKAPPPTDKTEARVPRRVPCEEAEGEGLPQRVEELRSVVGGEAELFHKSSLCLTQGEV
jgi:hypothetical protein